MNRLLLEVNEAFKLIILSFILKIGLRITKLLRKMKVQVSLFLVTKALYSKRVSDEADRLTK